MANRLLLSKLSFVLTATILLWIKTYIVYKSQFDIKIENATQEFILFINPLSFLLLIFGVGLFFKSAKGRNRYTIITSFIITFVLFANVMFYRFFNDFLTLPVLFQTSNMGDLGNSAFELFQWTDILMFIDVIALVLIGKFLVKKNETVEEVQQGVSRKTRFAYYVAVVAVFISNLALAETERPELLTRAFDREMLVKNIGTYNYHIYDAVLQSKTKAQRALADSSEFVEIENYLKANQKAPNEELYGVAKDKNVIVVSLESLQDFVIGNTVNGQEVTPFLNDFIEESYYFENFYHQTGQGKTSDSEFLLDNSLYPLGRGSVFFTHGGNEFNGTPEILKQSGYYSAVFHANNRSFWNRDVVYPRLGYDRFFSLADYEVNPENSVGWGLKDKEFFEQSVEHMKNLPQPFYTKFITLTNHFPFELDEEDKMVDEFDSNSRTLNRYFPTVRYMDEAFKHFIEDLKAEGLYEDSIIVVYGDHYGISQNHNAAMEQYLGKEVTPYQWTQLQKVPMIIHIPGEEHKGKKISKVSGQIDLKPTILHLLGVDTKDHVQFGSDMFSEEKMDFAVLRDGSFITDKYVYADNKCFDKATEEETDLAACEPYMEKAKQELDYSDKIVYGDLLRFYEGKNYRLEKEDDKE
ncbi:LTA synthase family protein [Bacillus sp. CGMCC 1.16541]|uniref:LTA synthase family protein n=1 Tax=Bacillus sp. CGMCC 1.16541 TaxID=2185143 RepID=UPI001EF4636F|nr:LTA synthase family protein [Bacillus sp. CGMCC 1.16541]